MYPRLPPRCNLEHLRKDAKAVLRVVERHKDGWRLADAQHAVARGYGFLSWSRLKAHVESLAPTSGAARIERRPRANGTHEHQREEHPIQGTWTESRTNSTSPQGAPIQFLSLGVAGDLLTMTHVTLGSLGHDMAVRMAIRTDGQEHPIDDGGTQVLQARWINARVLEMTAKKASQAVARGVYELSEDGATLTISSTEHVVVFERA